MHNSVMVWQQHIQVCPADDMYTRNNVTSNQQNLDMVTKRWEAHHCGLLGAPDEKDNKD